MLPTIDFTQQLAQLQSQLNTFGNPVQNYSSNKAKEVQILQSMYRE